MEGREKTVGGLISVRGEAEEWRYEGSRMIGRYRCVDVAYKTTRNATCCDIATHRWGILSQCHLNET